jgi:membrane protein required for colicin V production
MTWVDLAVLGILAVSALLAFMRGLVREILGIGAWIGAAAAAVEGLPMARQFVRGWMSSPEWVDPISFAAVFLISLVILSLIARAISRQVRGSALGGVDRTLGLVFGLMRGGAVAIAAYLLAGMVVSQQQWPEPVQKALLLPMVCKASNWAVEFLPSDKDEKGGYVHRPRIWDQKCSFGRSVSSEALLQLSPQGTATGRPPARRE